MLNIEGQVKQCYESAPFPDSLRKSKDFNKELTRITNWISLNLTFLSKDFTQYHPKTILCAGCGTGEEALALSKIFPNSQIEAIDIAKSSLDIARLNIKKAKAKNIKLKYCSIIEDLPNLKQNYDFIYCAGVIHHLANPKQGFHILTSKLNNDGSMVIMLYNSYGLFLYKCQLFILDILAGDNFNKRITWVKSLGFGKGKNKVFIYDTYINPQIKTYSIEDIKRWANDEHLKISGIVPPLNLKRIVEFAISAEGYVFRRKKILSIIMIFLKLLYKNSPSKNQNDKQPLLPYWKTFPFQMIFLFLGKGECQYLFEKKAKAV